MFNVSFIKKISQKASHTHSQSLRNILRDYLGSLNGELTTFHALLRTYGYTPPLYSGQYQQRDWIDQRNDRTKPPKVKQFMSKLVNKSLAFGGYRTCSRDELSAITSDKIYDAFISYDKRDESFVVQHLSAELEYGQPHYR